MNSDDLLIDIKQLLHAELSQTEERIITQLRGEVREQGNSIRDEMKAGFAGTGVPLSSINDQVADHEERLTKLEAKAA